MVSFKGLRHDEVLLNVNQVRDQLLLQECSPAERREEEERGRRMSEGAGGGGGGEGGGVHQYQRETLVLMYFLSVRSLVSMTMNLIRVL